METLIKLFTDEYGPVWILVALEAWMIWWTLKKFLEYIERDLKTKVELAQALKELNDRRLADNRGNR